MCHNYTTIYIGIIYRLFNAPATDISSRLFQFSLNNIGVPSECVLYYVNVQCHRVRVIYEFLVPDWCDCLVHWDIYFAHHIHLRDTAHFYYYPLRCRRYINFNRFICSTRIYANKNSFSMLIILYSVSVSMNKYYFHLNLFEKTCFIFLI